MPTDAARPPDDGDVFAAADLGSNSFHLVVARYGRGELRVIDRLRESVCVRFAVSRRRMTYEEGICPPFPWICPPGYRP